MIHAVAAPRQMQRRIAGPQKQRLGRATSQESLQKERDMYQQDVEHLRQSLRERKNAESSSQLE